MSIKNILLEFNVVQQKEDINVLLKKIGHEIEGKVDYYVGSGYFGDVFKIEGVDKIIKVSLSKREFGAIDKLVGKKLDNVMEYYFARALTKNDTVLVVVVGEYLDPLPWSNAHNKFYDMMVYASERAFFGDPLHGDNPKGYFVDMFSVKPERKELSGLLTEMIKKQKNILSDKAMDYIYYYTSFALRKNLPNRDVEEFLIEFNKYPNLVADIINGLDELKRVGIEFGDLHGRNVLYSNKTKKFKLIDISL